MIRPGPGCQVTGEISGSSFGSQKRASRWSKARHLRAMLLPVATQQEVASQLRVTRQAVEQLELSALAKLLEAFKQERNENLLT